MSKNKIFKQIYQYLLVTIGGTLNAVSLHVFVNPLQLIPGGFSGIASLIYYIVPQWDMSVIYLIINIPLLVVALIVMRGDFTFKTIWATIVCTAVLAILPEGLVFVAEPIISVVFAGFVIGMSMYVAHLGNGSNGGTEVIGRMITAKNPELDPSHSILLLNMAILSIGSLVLIIVAHKSVLVVFYSVLFVYLGGTVLGILGRGFNHPQKLLIVTDKHKQISQLIVNKTHRGVTILPTYDNQGCERDKKMVMVLCRYRQSHMLKQLISSCDKDAFVVIKDIHYVFSRPDFIRGYKYDKTNSSH